MNTELTPLLTAAVIFGWGGGIVFTLIAVYLSVRHRRLHPLFPPGLPRMPSWWPLNMTWGGLPSSVPIGYISYFVLPAAIGAGLGRWASARFGWRRPTTLLTVGLVVGFCWALFFNAVIGARLGVFYYGLVIPGLAIFEGTKNQYPIYDAVAMGVQVMVFTYLLGRTDAQGRNVIEVWADKVSKTKMQSAILSVVAVVVIAHLMYGAVFAPHLAAKLGGYVTSGPTEQLFPGVPNQPR